jgi:hypothetical protein
MPGSQSRVARLRELVREAATEQPATFPVPYKGKQMNIVMIDVPIDFPLYNVMSGRTHRAQSRYIEKHGLPADFFSDPEDPKVQQAQHDLLLEMVDLEGLAKDLEEKQQKNPLVLTKDGFVVDGNRRLAALRRDKGAEYVRTVRLPEAATDQEIYETELELQMSRETKAQYNWIDEALHVRYGVKRLYEGKAHDALMSVAKRMNRGEADVQDILRRLDLIDMYLAWRGEPGKYHLVPETSGGGSMEQAFKELEQRVVQKEYQRLSPEQRKLALYACFAVIESQSGYKDVRRVWSQVIEAPTKFMNRVRSALPKSVVERAESEQPRERTASSTHAGGLLDDLAKAEGEGPKPQAHAVALVSVPAVAAEVGKALKDTALDMEAEERDDQKHSEPREKIARALRDIEAVKLTKSTRHLELIAKDLDKIGRLVGRLAEDIGKLRSERD